MSDSGKITTGIRNRNYLNVKNNPKNPWQGSSGNDDRGHTIFKAPEWGLRAAIMTLRTYWFSYGLRNAIGILSRWAPASDTIGTMSGNPHNDPADYARFVCKRLRLGITDDLQLFKPDKSLNNLDHLKGLIEAMAEFENFAGFDVPDDELTKAFFLIEPDLAPSTPGGPPPPPAPPLAPPLVPVSPSLGEQQLAQLRELLSKMSALDLLSRLSIPVPLPEQPGLNVEQPLVGDVLIQIPEPTVPLVVPKPFTSNLIPRASRPSAPTGCLCIDDALMRAIMLGNAFSTPPDGSDTVILFGFRGCVPVDPEDWKPGGSKIVRLGKVNHVNPKCTLGHWFPARREVAIFPGSTVPTARYVRSAMSRDGEGTNQLLTGYYSFTKGRHHLGTKTEHDAFRQSGNRVFLRSADDVIYEPDTDKLDSGDPSDNLHAAFGTGMDGTFSSAGCQVVMGMPTCRQYPRGDAPPWTAFRDAAYATGQKLFRYILIAAEEVVQIDAALGQPFGVRLRCGSHESALPGDLAAVVKKVQTALGVGADGDFGAQSALAAIRFQRTKMVGTDADAIVGPLTGIALGITDWPQITLPS